ncbi:helix-turn-helix transcriptional regulator [Jiangella gansuensis]|uniref:helix-turn-helix transcriptional regulator n=1 Tax=Jiangella gansuensis TaxID=281473 RepID=UPI00047D042A|nr:helix-turn-helix transcriptional regulator [Jiangella gansuensis]
MADADTRLGDFLRARRELARPEDVGLPAGWGRRRVPGLRREEVAMLAGVSADYYVRLEQGRDKHPSEQVVDALARVFGLDDDAAAHLRELARPTPRRRRAPSRPEKPTPGVLRLLERWPDTPALVLGRYLDVLAANRLALALNSCSGLGVNQVRAVFLDPAARDIYPDWDTVALETVASLRAAAGADLDEPRLTELVGELSLKSDQFRRLWARHDVRPKTSGTKRFMHPLVGELTLAYDTLAVASAPGQLLVAYHAEPGSPSERALALLGSATAPVAEPAPAAATASVAETAPGNR